ncbi:MAG: OB-fold protein [Arenimonas sp.]
MNAIPPPVTVYEQPQNNKAKNAAWTCLAIAWLCFLVPLPGLGLFIGWPLNLVAFILAIVAMSKGGAMAGIWQLLLSLIGSPIVYFVGFAIMMAFAGGAQKASEQRATTASAPTEQVALQPAQSEAPAMEVKAGELFSAYEANEVAADQIYKGKRLAVTGKVDDIKKDFTDSIYVTLGIDMFKNVHVSGLPESVAAGLHKGQTITVVCEGNGMIMLSPMLKDCVLQ